MISEEDNSDIKLVDFGLAKTLGPNETSNEAFGTLCYVAPEILLQNSYDKSVDLWSLGVLIHLMLSGSLPFDAKEDREIARLTIYQEIQFQNPVWNEVSIHAKDLIMGKSIFK
jgi:serine/threonine protein kinase